jgi:hypothetical protein
MTLTPARGRDYSSKSAVLEDFLANKDFLAQLPGGGRPLPINRQQIEEENRSTVNVRYKNLGRVVVLLRTPGGLWSVK